MSIADTEGRPTITRKNVLTIAAFKRVMRELADQDIHISVSTGGVEFWKRNTIHRGRSHGVCKPFRTKAVK